MRRIRCRYGVIPRAFDDHRTPEGAAYRAYCGAIMARLGKLPPSAAPILREAGRLAVDLDAIGRELDAARKRKGPAARKEVARLRRQATPMRTQLLKLEERLETLATDQRLTPAQRLASMPDAK